MNLWKESYKEIKKVRSIALCALLIALNVAAKALNIQVTQDLKIGFSGVFMGLSGLLVGPFLSGLGGIIADTLGYIVNPTGPYFPGFAINELVIGLIYGFMFYKQKEIKLSRVIIARLLHTILINILLTPIWLNILYGTTFFAIPRLIKNIVLFPVDVFILYTVLNIGQKIFKRIK